MFEEYDDGIGGFIDGHDQLLIAADVAQVGLNLQHEVEILESDVTKKRDKKAALKFMKKAIKRHGSPEAITTDGLRSYNAAMSELGNSDK